MLCACVCVCVCARARPPALLPVHRFCNYCKLVVDGSRRPGKRAEPPQCLICKEFGGALLQCDVKGSWVHTLCAGMLPETSIVRWASPPCPTGVRTPQCVLAVAPGTWVAPVSMGGPCVHVCSLVGCSQMRCCTALVAALLCLLGHTPLCSFALTYSPSLLRVSVFVG